MINENDIEIKKQINNIYTLFENPNNIGSFNGDVLLNNSKKYPFFKEIHALLVKFMYKRNHVFFDEKLKEASIYINHQIKFYNLIQNISHSELDIVTIDEPFIENFNFFENKSTSCIKKENYNKNIPNSNNKINHEENINDNVPKQKIIEQTKKTINNTKKKNETLNINNSKKIIVENFEEEKPISTSKNEFSENNSLLIQWLQNKKTSPKKKTNDINIIENFILKNPSISKQDNPKQYKKPTEFILNSIKDNEEIITETLANIYIKQGNIKKAISIYKKLILEYPNKKHYFAKKLESLYKK